MVEPPRKPCFELPVRFSKPKPLPGSAPRGPSAGKTRNGVKLLGREKEVLEHRLVIESILRRLRSIGLTDCREGRARLLRLANLQHARTPVQAKMTEGIHPFDALSALHPTPAMGGTPREVALPLVGKLEKTPRAWYSGVTGWLDSRGRGEFVVPIRPRAKSRLRLSPCMPGRVLWKVRFPLKRRLKRTETAGNARSHYREKQRFS